MICADDSITMPAPLFAQECGLFVTQFNSGAKRNPSNGFRVFSGRTPRDHFDAGWLIHCDTLETLEAFICGFVEGQKTNEQGNRHHAEHENG